MRLLPAFLMTVGSQEMGKQQAAVTSVFGSTVGWLVEVTTAIAHCAFKTLQGSLLRMAKV